MVIEGIVLCSQHCQDSGYAKASPSGPSKIHTEEPVLLCCCLGCQCPRWSLVQAQASPLPIQLPANMPRKVLEDGLSTCVPCTHVGDMVVAPSSWFQLQQQHTE